MSASRAVIDFLQDDINKRDTPHKRSSVGADRSPNRQESHRPPTKSSVEQRQATREAILSARQEVIILDSDDDDDDAPLSNPGRTRTDGLIRSPKVAMRPKIDSALDQSVPRKRMRIEEPLFMSPISVDSSSESSVSVIGSPERSLEPEQEKDGSADRRSVTNGPPKLTAEDVLDILNERGLKTAAKSDTPGSDITVKPNTLARAIATTSNIPTTSAYHGIEYQVGEEQFPKHNAARHTNGVSREEAQRGNERIPPKAQSVDNGDVPQASIESPADQIANVTTNQLTVTSSNPVPPHKAIELDIGRQVHDLRDATVYSTKVFLRRARLSLEATDRTTKQASSTLAASVFANLKRLRCEVVPPRTHTSKGVLLNNAIRPPGAASRPSKMTLAVPVTKRSMKEKKRLPQYSHVVRLQENSLSPNVTVLYCWPYFGDEFEPRESDLKDRYTLDVDIRPVKLHRLQIAQWLFSASEAALCNAELDWGDILAFLFCEVKQIKKNILANTILQNKPGLVDEEFPEDAPRWLQLSTEIGYRDEGVLVRAAFFCDAFRRVTGLSIWHVLRRSRLVREYCADPEEMVSDLSSRECRVCFRFDCPAHGEIRHGDSDDEDVEEDAEEDDQEEPDSQQSDTVVIPDDADIVNPIKRNYRKRVRFGDPAQTGAAVSIYRKKMANPESRNYKRPDDRGPFYPCDHPGESCHQAHCTCFRLNVHCEKYCSCASDCVRKFQGCSCLKKSNSRKSGGELVCFKDERCACYTLGRECDPDLCGRCGVYDVLNAAKERSEQHRLCHNASIQLGTPKRTLLGDSAVHQLGLYAGEPIVAHDFIGEYKGELITKEEAERRGAIYDHQKLSYLFTLNQDQEVDSTYCGNKVRFINHNNQGAKNVYAFTMLVNTVHRIALFAERSIAVGEELFFDYGPQFPHEQLGGKTVSKAAPHARNVKLLKEFANPQEVVTSATKTHGKVSAVSKKEVSSATKTKEKISTVSKKEVSPATKTKGKISAVSESEIKVKSPKPVINASAKGVARVVERQHISAGERLAAYNVADDSASDDSGTANELNHRSKLLKNKMSGS